MLKQDSITSEYPPSIDEYVSTNHPNTSILEVSKQDDGTFVAKLADGIELSFDSEGNLIDEEDTDDQNGDEENGEEDTDDQNGDEENDEEDTDDQNGDEENDEEDTVDQDGDEENSEEDTDDQDGDEENCEEDTDDQNGDEENDEEDTDEGESDSDENVREYPEVIDTYLANNHSNATIDSIKLDEHGSYIAVLNDEVEIEFNADGTFADYLD